MQMHLHKVKYCDFIVYTSINVYVCRTLYNKSFCENMRMQYRKFWFKHVLPEIKAHKLLKDCVPPLTDVSRD